MSNTSAQTTYAGSITDGSGVVSLTKAGSGSLYLTGSNSQSGTTYITGGNVRTGSGGSSTDSNNFAFGTGDVVVSGSGTLAVRNSSTVANNLTIGGVGSSASTGSLAGSFAAANQTAVVSGSVTLATDSLISTWGANVGTGSKLSLTGPINLGSNALTFSQVVTGTTVRSVTAPTTWIEVGGAISGAGSVIVNGVRFDDTSASVLDDDGGGRDRANLSKGRFLEKSMGERSIGGRVGEKGFYTHAHTHLLRFFS